MTDNYSSIISIVALIPDFVIAVVAFLSFLKIEGVLKKNRIHVNITIIDDTQREKNYWFFNIKLENCDKTIKTLRLTLDNHFSYLNHKISSEDTNFFVNKANCVTVKRITGEDILQIGYTIDSVHSKKYLQILDETHNINSVLKYANDSLRLILGDNQYSHFELNAKN